MEPLINNKKKFKEKKDFFLNSVFDLIVRSEHSDKKSRNESGKAEKNYIFPKNQNFSYRKYLVETKSFFYEPPKM